MKTYFSQISVEAVAASAELRLAHTSKYRDPCQREALIAEVRAAVTPYNTIGPSPDLSAPPFPGENPIRRLAPVSRGFANGFLIAHRILAPDFRRLIDKHTLFHAGLAALALTLPTDDRDAILLLQGLVETWRDGKSAAPRRRNAQEPRSPFVLLVQNLRRQYPAASAKEFWNHLCGEHQVRFQDTNCQICVTESPDCAQLEWYCYGTGQDKEGIRRRKGFDEFVSKYAPKNLP